MPHVTDTEHVVTARSLTEIYTRLSFSEKDWDLESTQMHLSLYVSPSSGDRFVMNRKRLIWCVLPILVLATSFLAGFPKAIAQKAQDRNQAGPGQDVMAWESPARLHRAMGTEKGNLRINNKEIEFLSTKGRSFKWPFVEVQTFFLAPHSLAIETYKNRKHHLPGMQRFRFDLDQTVSPEIAAELSRKVGRPSQNAVPDQASQGIVILAHHRTLSGGTNGSLRFTTSGIDYVTDVRDDSRSWRWADLQTLSDPDPYHLLVFGYRDTYAFDLKDPLPQSMFYRMVDAVDTQNEAESDQWPSNQSPNSTAKHEHGDRNE